MNSIKTTVLLITIWVVQYLSYTIIISSVTDDKFNNVISSPVINMVYFALGWIIPIYIADSYHKYLTKKQK